MPFPSSQIDNDPPTSALATSTPVTVFEPSSLPESVTTSQFGPWIYMVGVVVLGIIGLVTVIGSLALAYAGKAVDGAAIAIGAGAVSALALMIAPGAKGAA